LFEAVIIEPREEGALPSPSALCRAVDGLLDALYSGLAVFADVGYLLSVAGCASGITRWERTVNYFSLFKLSLKVCGDKVPAAHV